MPDNRQYTSTSDPCPNCGVLPGEFHALTCASGKEIWLGHTIPQLALEIRELRRQLDRGLERISSLEAATPEVRQGQCPAALAQLASAPVPGTDATGTTTSLPNMTPGRNTTTRAA